MNWKNAFRVATPTLSIICALFWIIACAPFMNSPVPLVTSDAAVYPLDDGEYELYDWKDRESPDSWVMSQSGVQITRAQGRYLVRVLPHAKTFVNAGDKKDVRTGGLFLITIWQGKKNPFAPGGGEGFAIGGLDNGYFFMQMPGSDDLKVLPTDEKNLQSWLILPTRKRSDAFEIGMLEEKATERASMALLGAKQECDSDGKCKEIPVVKAFTNSPETNRALLKRAISESEPQSVVRLVRVR